MILKDLLRAIRIPNVILVFLAQLFFSIKYNELTLVNICIIALTGVLIAIGNIENNLLDYELDLNCKGKSRNKIIEWLQNGTRFRVLEFIYISLLSITIFKFELYVFIFGLTAFLLLKIYNHKLKKTFMIGNLAIALLCAAAIKALKIETCVMINLFCMIIFLLTLCREIIKDKEDEICDSQFGYKTLAIQLQNTTVKGILWTLLFLTIIVSFYLYKTKFLLILATLFLSFILSFFIYKNDWKKASLSVKLLILFGVISIWII